MSIKLPAPVGIRSIFTRALLLAIMGSMLLTNASVYARTAAEQRLVNYDAQYLDYSSLQECTSSGTGTEIDRFLRALAHKESTTGDPTAQNPSSSASGRYQYIDSTWKAHAALYYKPALQYAHAKDAPDYVQDAVAYIEYSVKFNTYEGDLTALAISHFGGDGVAKDPSQWDMLAPGANAGATYREYAEDFLKKADSPEAQAILLKYTQAPGFEEALSAAGVNAGTNSAATTGCSGTQIGDFVLYLQFDPKWENHPYGDSTMGPTGCGPTSMAMVVATLADKSVTPPQVADWSGQNGHVRPGVPPNGGGSEWELFTEGAKHWGLKAQELFTTNDSPIHPTRPSQADIDAVTRVLKSGGLVIASGRGAIPFTTGGHILVIRGIDDSGKWLLGDPGHNREYPGNIPNPNKHAYQPNELTPDIRGLWGITK